MDPQELTELSKRLQQIRGDQEAHHGRCDEVAYGVLESLLSGVAPAELLEAAQNVVKERGAENWWYA